jgi:peptidoglycan/xylan/chitin deacetylase (PgdA/CDA1 family)
LFNKEDPWNYGSSYEKEKYQRQLQLIPPDAPERALELACAEGHFTRELVTKVKHLVASDISARALARARVRCRGHHNVDFVKLDLSADVIPGAMDLICCSEVLYYLNDEAELELVAQKLTQALRPGGHLITAHAFVLKDDMSRSGFDWENPYGAETIARVMEKVPGLALETSIQTELYRVDRYRRLQSGEVATGPQIIVAQIDAPIEREVARFIVRNGAVRRRSEVAQSERRTHVPALTYHRIATDGPGELARYRVHPDAFEEQMLWLRRNGYHTINSEQLTWFIINDWPFEGRPLLMTFDDGYEDFAELAWPILKANDLSAEVFIVTDLVGRCAEWDASCGTPAPLMDADKIIMLAAGGVSFGSHLASHPRSDRLSSSELAEEMLRSRLQLEAWLERPTTSLAAPFGCTDQRLRILAAECGYKTVFNTVGRAARLKDDLYDLPRIEVRGDCTFEEFVRCLEACQ